MKTMCNRRMSVRSGVVLASVCAVVLFCTHLQAVTYTFVPGGANDWWVNGNWTPAGFPNSVNDLAIFNASANPSYSTNTHPSSPYTVREMRFDTSSNWRIHNNERDINLDAPSGNALITQNGSGTVTYDSDWILIDNTTLGGTGTGEVILNGSILTGPGQRRGIFGAGSLTKEGSFTATINAIIQHTGGTTIDGGVFRLNQGGLPLAGGSNGQFGSSGQTVTVNSGATLRLTNNWVMGGGQQHELVADGGTIEFTGADNYQSKITLTGGTVTTSGGSRPWRVGNFGNALITVNESNDESLIQGTLCFVKYGSGGTATFDVANGNAANDLVLSALIYDHPGPYAGMRLVKTGPGTLRLTNTGSSWDGGLSINGGIVSVPQLTAGNVNGPLGGWFGTSAYFSFDGGTLEYTGGSVGGINRAFLINPGGATLDIANAAATVTWTDGSGAGPIIGPGTLTKAGPGTLVLASSNAYTGGTLVDGGTLRLGHVNSLGTGAATVNSGATLDLAGANVANNITINGGTLFTANGISGTITLNNVAGNTINANGNYRVLSGQITGTGGFTFGGINTPGLALSNPANDFLGDVTVNGNAYLGVWADEVIPDTANLTLLGQLRLQGDGRTETIAGLNGSNRIFAANGGVGPTLRFGAGGASGNFSGPIGLGGANNKNISLVKIGAGTQALSGVLDHTGTTTVDGGILRLNRGGVAFPGAGATGQFTSPHTVTVNSGATLQVNGSWVMGDGLANKIVVNGGTLEFLNSDNYMGNIELTGGAITTSGGLRPWRTGNWGSGLITVNASAASSTIAGSLCFVGTGAAPNTTFDVADGAAADDLVVSARIFDHPGFERRMMLVKDGPGKMILSNNSNTFAGGVTINDGTLSVTSLNAGNEICALGKSYGIAPMLVFNGGTLEYTGPTVGGINRAFTINAGGATLDITNAATTVTWTDAAGAGPIIGTGTLTKAGPGTLVLASSNAYTGGTTVSQGTLQLGHGNAAGTGTITLGDANTGASHTALLLASQITVGNPVVATNQGTGTVTIGSTNSTSGWNRQLNGLLTLNRDVTLQAGASDRTTLRGQITGTGNLLVTSPFAVHRRIVFDRPGGAANDFVGDVYLAANADLQLGVANSIGNRTMPDGSDVHFAPGSRLRLAPTGSGDGETLGALISDAPGAGTVDMFTGSSFTLTIGGANASGTFGGGITDSSGNLSITKTGTGTQTLTGSGGRYTFASATVDDGVLELMNNGDGSGDGFRTPVVNNATLWLTSTGPRSDFRANISGAGTIIKKGPGMVRLGPWGGVAQVTGSGDILVEEGTLQSAGRSDYRMFDTTGDLILSPGTTFDYSALNDFSPATASRFGALIGSGNVTVGWGTHYVQFGNGDKSGEHSGSISGNLSITKIGAGTQIFSGPNTYAGTTNVDAGTLLVNGTHTGGGQYTVAAGATLGGTGDIDSGVDLSGAVSPGASVGTFYTNSETWHDGGSFLFEINDVDAGPGTGWDLLDVTGNLDLTGLSVGGFTVDVVSLTGATPGPAADFDVLGTYEWEFVRTSAGVDGFDARDFVVDSSGFQNELAAISRFYVFQDADSLFLGYTVPEPSTFVLAALGLLGLALYGRRRKR